MNNGYFLYQQPAPESPPISGDFAAIAGLSLGTPDIIKLFGSGMVYRMENGYFSYLPPRRIKGVFGSNNAQYFFISDSCEILTAPEMQFSGDTVLVQDNAEVIVITYHCFDVIVEGDTQVSEVIEFDCQDSILMTDENDLSNAKADITDIIFVGDTEVYTEQNIDASDYLLWNDTMSGIDVRNIIPCVDTIFVGDNKTIVTQTLSAFEIIISSDKVSNVGGNVVYKIDAVDTIWIRETGVIA